MTTFEKTWQFQSNNLMDTSNATNDYKHLMWWYKAFLKGDVSNNVGSNGQGTAFNYQGLNGSTLTSISGLWTCYYSCDGVNVGTAGDGYDRWGTQGLTTANSGSAASLVSGATITGAIRITGVTGLSSSLGNYLTITGSATSANNSPTGTPFKIVKVNSATDVEIYNPNGVTGDANNGSISWQERGLYTTPASYSTIVNNAAGAHSWIVLKSPAGLGPIYFTIDLNVSTNNVSFVYAKTAPTGGSTTARPTSVDEVYPSAGNWNNIQVHNGGTTVRAHGGLATDGNFHMMSSFDGNGFFYSIVMLQYIAEAKSLDNYPVHMYFKGANSGVLTIGNITGNNTLTNASFFGRTRTGLTMIANDATQWCWNTSSGQLFVNALTTTDYADSQYNDMPVYIYNQVSGYKSLRGRWIDYRWCPGNIPSGAIESSQTSPTSVVIGNFWIPYNAIPQI